MPEKECKYQKEVYKVQTFRTTHTKMRKERFNKITVDIALYWQIDETTQQVASRWHMQLSTIVGRRSELMELEVHKDAQKLKYQGTVVRRRTSNILKHDNP